MPLPIEVRLGPGARGFQATGRALRSLYLKLIREGTKYYVTRPGTAYSAEFKAFVSGAWAGLKILAIRWLYSLPNRVSGRIMAAAQNAPDVREIELADFNLARQALVQRTCQELGAASEAFGYDTGNAILAGVAGAYELSKGDGKHGLKDQLKDDQTHKHPIVDGINDVLNDLFRTSHIPHIFGGEKDPKSPVDHPWDTPPSTQPDPQPPRSTGVTSGNFAGLVHTFYNPVTSRIIGYKGIRPKRRMGTLEKYSQFWRDQSVLGKRSRETPFSPDSVFVAPSQA